MKPARLITGIAMVVLGVVLILIPLFYKEISLFVFLIYGLPILIIGFFILFNAKEDFIEGRKDLLNKGNKK